MKHATLRDGLRSGHLKLSELGEYALTKRPWWQRFIFRRMSFTDAMSAGYADMTDAGREWNRFETARLQKELGLPW